MGGLNEGLPTSHANAPYNPPGGKAGMRGWRSGKGQFFPKDLRAIRSQDQPSTNEPTQVLHGVTLLKMSRRGQMIPIPMDGQNSTSLTLVTLCCMSQQYPSEVGIQENTACFASKASMRQLSRLVCLSLRKAVPKRQANQAV